MLRKWKPNYRNKLLCLKIKFDIEHEREFSNSKVRQTNQKQKNIITKNKNYIKVIILPTWKIINAINEINLFSDGSKQTLQIFIPSNTTLKCNSLENKISFETQLIQEPYPIECNQGKCKKEYGLNIDIQCPITQLNGPQKVNLTIQKANSQITLLRSG